MNTLSIIQNITQRCIAISTCVLCQAFSAWSSVSLVFFLLCSCHDGQTQQTEEFYIGKTIPFKLNQPSISRSLPFSLKEISGLTWEGENLYAAQDEIGVLFELNDLLEISNKYQFTGPGDFEALTSKDGNIYALTSDGLVFEIDAKDRKKSKLLPVDFHHSCDFESMSQIGDKLFVVSKGNCDDDDFPGKGRCIFSYDFISQKSKWETDLDYKEIKKSLGVSDESIHLGDKVYPYYKPKPSGLAVDPITSVKYLLCDKGKLLFTLDDDWKIIDVAVLNASIHEKPEGIAFDNKGNLFIANEGKSGSGKLYKFDRQQDN